MFSEQTEHEEGEEGEDEAASPVSPARQKLTSMAPNDTESWLKDEITEMFNHFNHKLFDALLKSTKMSLDQLRKRVFFQKMHG